MTAGKGYKCIMPWSGIMKVIAILASPVYFNSVSARLKTFMDRTADCRHCMLMEGKYGMSVTTTASSGAERTVDYMTEYLVNSGAFVVGSAYTAMPYMPKNMETASKKAFFEK